MALLTPALFQAFNDNAGFLSGGKLYSYEPETTTPKTTYSDVNLTTAHTNPIILDSRGESAIYISDTETYKFVLTDSDDVEIWTLDNYSVPGSAGEVVADALVINGGFDVWTDGTSFSMSDDQQWTANQWLCNFGDAGASLTATVTRQAFSDSDYISNGAQYFLRFAVTVASGATTIGPQIFQNIQRNEYGFLNTGNVTLTFWARSHDESLTTIKPRIQRADTIDWFDDCTLTATWQKFTTTIELTEENTGRSYNQLSFSFPPNTIGNLDICQVRLDVGSVAKDYRYIPYSETVERCEYYNKRNTYYPDSSQADHGVASGNTLFRAGVTLLDICTTIGTSNMATVVFRHIASAATTNYTIDTDLDLSSYGNITFVFEPGARLTRSTTETITFYRPTQLVFNDRQAITSDIDMIAFSLDAAKYGQVEVFPWISTAEDNVRLPNGLWLDTSASTTNGIQEAIDYAFGDGTAGNASYSLHIHGEEAAAGGAITYSATTTITFPPMQNAVFTARSIIISNTARPAVQFDSMQYCTIDMQGSQVVTTDAGPAVSFVPTNNLPAIATAYIKYCDVNITAANATGASDGVNQPTVMFDASSYPIDSNSFEFGLINQAVTSTNSFGVTAKSGAASTFQNNTFKCLSISAVGNTGLRLGHSTGYDNILGNTVDVVVAGTSQAGSVGVGCYGQKNQINLGSGSSGFTSVCTLQAESNDNIVICPSPNTTITDSGTTNRILTSTAGDIVPSTDNILARYDGTTGIQGTGITVDNDDNITDVNSITVTDGVASTILRPTSGDGTTYLVTTTNHKLSLGANNDWDDLVIDLSSNVEVTTGNLQATLGNISTVAGDITSAVDLTYGGDFYYGSDLQPKYKQVQIGDWNMDANGSVTVAHGLSMGGILCVTAVVRDDSDTYHYQSGGAPTGQQGGDFCVQGWDGTNVTLVRETGGQFDNPSFDSTSYDRGHIAIWHV